MTSKIAFVSPERLSKLLNNEHRKAQRQVEFELHECIAEQNRSVVIAIDKRRDIEVIVNGGGNATMIETMQLDTPLVKSKFPVLMSCKHSGKPNAWY